MESQPIVELRGVGFAYDGRSVLEDVCLAVEKRDFMCIVGPNAGGKTTLLKLILGLLRPTQGAVRVFGVSPVKARQRMGYMPQYATLDPLFPVSVLDVALMGRLGDGRRLGFYNSADRAAADEALRRVELVDVRDRSFAELSGGQRQRVLIARALVGDPELLLLDEPTSNVDAVAETELYELLRELNRKMTVVLVTHDLGFVSSYVNRVACVNRRVVVHATSEVTGAIISELYGADVQMVRHDTREPNHAHHHG